MGLPSEHFGNASVLVEAPIDPTAVPERWAEAIHRAVKAGPGMAPNASRPASVHVTTWWHGLQREFGFGSGAEVACHVGPGSLASAAQYCLGRGGQPNATVLPGAESGSF